ncbi:MAG: DotA/TraY family protein, partial [Deltaproteobacteria bacterium]|nr:DotA/TraY family protein [Deltaproteobacteria bacterium]
AAWGSFAAGMLATGTFEAITGASVAGTGPGAPTATVGMALLAFASLIAPLVLAGVVFAYYVPFIPAILWYAGIISYGIICVEAVAATPLWMLAHLESEGDGLGQRTSHGYLFVLNVLFRPVLMTIGLIAGWLLSNIWGELMHYLLVILYGTSSYGFNGIASVFGYVMSVGIMAALSMMTISKSFSLIHHLPNEVLAWVGGHIKPVGGGEDDSAKHFVAGGMGAYSSAAGKGMQKRSGAAGERVKTALEKAKAAEGKGDKPS